MVHSIRPGHRGRPALFYCATVVPLPLFPRNISRSSRPPRCPVGALPTTPLGCACACSANSKLERERERGVKGAGRAINGSFGARRHHGGVAGPLCRLAVLTRTRTPPHSLPRGLLLLPAYSSILISTSSSSSCSLLFSSTDEASCRTYPP